jgi:6-phosphogluconolactonase (cycloisomerase 2 family)
MQSGALAPPLSLPAIEQGDTIAAFGVDASSGKLAPTGQVVKNASAVTIVFAEKP